MPVFEESWCFPSGSVGKETACNSGGPSLIPGLGRATEEGISYPLQYSWASLMAQLIKNLPAMWEKEMATHSSVLAWRIPWTV